MSEVLNTVNTNVDRLGALNATIATLTEEANEIKAELAATGETEVRGLLFKAKISYVGPSDKVDWKAVAMKLLPSRQLIAAHTKLSGGGVRVALYDL